MRLHSVAPIVLLAAGGAAASGASSAAAAAAAVAVAEEEDFESPSRRHTGGGGGGSTALRASTRTRRRVQSATTSTVTYPSASPLSSPLPNPERGFYWQETYRSSASSGGAQRLAASSLISQRENTDMTLVLRLYYLDTFISSDISQDVLDDIAADFAAMRTAGVKCVLRFAYLDNNAAPFVSEPAKAQLLTHIAQLKPVLAGGEDVIAAVQAGFLGPWGEWHSSTHFDSDLDGRKEVVAALLDAVPGEKVVQIRTPTHKKSLYAAFQYPPPTSGYLSDGGFENGATSDWSSYMSGFVLETAETHDGSANSIKVTDGAARQWVAISPPAPAGHTVRISGHSKGVNVPTGAGSSYSIYADVAMKDGSGQSSYLWGQTANFEEGDTGSWEYAEHEFVVPAGKDVVGMTVYTMYRNQGQGHAFFDDVDVQVFGPPVQTAGQVLDATTAHDGTDIARTGHHNDCFLASDTDYGTYPDASQSQYSYLSDETKYTAMGGETCNPNPPRSECGTALQEMQLFHYTYVNSGYHQSVLNSWTTDGCMDEVKAKLGYRLVLKDGTFPDTAAPGSVVPFGVNFDNEGWAAPISERRVQLVFKHASTDELCAATADAASADARTWYGGQSHALSGEATLPSDMPGGQYSLHLHITDTSTALRTGLHFKTKVANGGALNDPDTGMIDLGHTINVAAGNPTSSSAGSGVTQIAVACGSAVEADILPPSSTANLAIDPNSLVYDGSFEGADVSVEWSAYGSGYSVTTSSDEVHSGSQAVEVSNGGAARQVVTLNAPAGSTVKISGYSKSSGVSTGLWNDYSIYTDVVYANGAGYLWGQCARFAGGTDTEGPDWTYAEWSFVAANDVAYLTLYTMYRNDSAGGTAWFDDVSVTVTPP